MTPIAASAVPPTIVLASTSPFRRELLARLGLPFSVVAPNCDETPLPQELPAALALRLAEKKARAAAEKRGGDADPALIIGCDQVACCREKIYGKPGTHENAVAQLSALSGQTVEFHTALCLFDARRDRAQVRNVRTQVTLRQLSATEIENYLRREPAYDCAGAAKFEGLGIALIARLEGEDPSALIGLPLIALCDLLRGAGVPIL
ncbi:MAG: Maf family nucleotide pyrophosphatase [Zoogloeaceae bacterium]|jgi:septum formation protein|nr:Maf family nucleotide pyrophosphatase [Zoogloeaceae bacterium]